MISYQINSEVFPNEISCLRKSVGWNSMEKYYDMSLKNSHFYISGYDNYELIGFLDVISNKSTDAYIQDDTVKPQYQGKCIGTKL